MSVFRWTSPEFWKWLNSQDTRPCTDTVLDFLQGFEKFECYHGCRVETVSSYYERGLEVHCQQELNRSASELLSVELDEIRRVSMEINDTDEGVVHVVLDARELIKKSGHYLIYGSEWIFVLAGLLGGDLRSRLRKRGKPTLLRMEVPFNRLSLSQLEQLAEYIPAALWEDLPHFQSIPVVSSAVQIRDRVPPEFVISHEHPTAIVDHHDDGRIYDYRKIEV